MSRPIEKYTDFVKPRDIHSAHTTTAGFSEHMLKVVKLRDKILSNSGGEYSSIFWKRLLGNRELYKTCQWVESPKRVQNLGDWIGWCKVTIHIISQINKTLEMKCFLRQSLHNALLDKFFEGPLSERDLDKMPPSLLYLILKNQISISSLNGCFSKSEKLWKTPRIN